MKVPNEVHQTRGWRVGELASDFTLLDGGLRRDEHGDVAGPLLPQAVRAERAREAPGAGQLFNSRLKNRSTPKGIELDRRLLLRQLRLDEAHLVIAFLTAKRGATC